MSEPIHIHYYDSPVGELILGDYQGKLCLCDWRFRKKREEVDRRITKGLSAYYVQEETELHRRVKSELDAYLNRQLTVFTIPLLLAGSEFQQSIWKALLQIPLGKTVSYLELSQQLGNPDAIRAVASANGANAISILVPCHRVIGSNGELTGYAGGISAKKKLLSLEGAHPQMELF